MTSQGASTGRVVHPRPSRRVEINTARMREARGDRSFRDLARAINAHVGSTVVSSARLGQIEAGNGSPSPALFTVLAKVLGVRENELRADAP